MDDVEETISLAVSEIARSKVEFLTIHGSGATARAAMAGRSPSESPKILSVTLLSSLDEQDLIDSQILGKKGRFKTLQEYSTCGRSHRLRRDRRTDSATRGP